MSGALFVELIGDIFEVFLFFGVGGVFFQLFGFF
jgi:hypothetical protein